MNFSIILLDIHKTQAAAYHPQCDGISERFMRPLKAMISSYIAEQQKDWDHNLDQFAFAYNKSAHASTQYTPFFLIHGREFLIKNLRHAQMNVCQKIITKKKIKK